jgi:hypothetical protein
MVFLYISLYLALLFGPDLCLQRSEEMGCQWLPKLPLKDKSIASPFHLKYVYVYTLIYENHTYIYIYILYIYIHYIYILYILYNIPLIYRNSAKFLMGLVGLRVEPVVFGISVEMNSVT